MPVAAPGTCVRAKLLFMANSLQPCGLHPTRLLCPWDFPGKNTRVGCHALLQGIFQTQRLNPRLMSPALAGRFFTISTTNSEPLQKETPSLQDPTITLYLYPNYMIF